MMVKVEENVEKIEGKRIGEEIKIKMKGKEKKIGKWEIEKMKLMMKGIRDERIEKGDKIRNKRMLDKEGKMLIYDRVIEKKKLQMDRWGEEEV